MMLDQAAKFNGFQRLGVLIFNKYYIDSISSIFSIT